ncbi:hypothetical protein LTR33_010392 [Friedmanniomyces endolithicus]|nr:hypothetical protein LTR33_010392 [Friedmanniomyces endolithicus]
MVALTPEEDFAHLRRPPSGLALDARYGVEKVCEVEEQGAGIGAENSVKNRSPLGTIFDFESAEHRVQCADSYETILDLTRFMVMARARVAAVESKLTVLARVNPLKTADRAVASPPQSAPPPCPKALVLGSASSGHEPAFTASPPHPPPLPDSNSPPLSSTSSVASTPDLDFHAVVEGTTRLHPTCYHTKGKLPTTEETHYTLCGSKPRCREALLKPTPSTGGHNFRLTTDDPVRDLGWWLGERCSRECDRDREFVAQGRFTEGQLRDVIGVAVEELRGLRGELRYLLEFAGREGYGLVFRDTEPAVAEGLKAEDLRGMDREGFLDKLDEVAVEIDRVGEKIERVEGEVVKKMVEVAEEGGWGGRECLWRLGFCDEVDGMC